VTLLGYNNCRSLSIFPRSDTYVAIDEYLKQNTVIRRRIGFSILFIANFFYVEQYCAFHYLAFVSAEHSEYTFRSEKDKEKEI
jgi:hypothetical protein